MTETSIARTSTARTSTVPISFEHVLSMSDSIGIFEHADHIEPRRSHGYCVDDVARLMVVLVREQQLDRSLRELMRTCFRFLTSAQNASGRIRNRRNAAGRWEGRHTVDDCWGRSVWAFGTAASGADTDWLRAAARSSFGHGVQQRSPHRRAMAFAALGAAEILRVDRHQYRAREMLIDAVNTIGPISSDPGWPWPEPRLTYANAVFPEVLITAGELLHRPAMLDDGLTLLRWLLARQTVAGHLSVTAVGGAGPGDHAPMFDQQPIEVAALADACARAFAITGDPEWRDGVDRSIGWFLGENDRQVVMFDPERGGGFDGLTPIGPNMNQGAESTLAMISTLQHGRAPLPRVDRTVPGFKW